jgi:hypothetical protein
MAELGVQVHGILQPTAVALHYEHPATPEVGDDIADRSLREFQSLSDLLDG